MGRKPNNNLPEWSKEKRDSVFIQYFMPHINSLYNFALYLENDEDRAKDLVQESFLRAYKFVHHYDTEQQPKAWLIKILKNTFINEYHRNKHMAFKVELEEAFQQSDDDEDTHVKNIDLREEIFNSLVGDEISEAVNSLRVDFRIIILLCDIEGFRYDEMAAILDVPIGTVRSRLHRARTALKEKLQDYAIKKGYTK